MQVFRRQVVFFLAICLVLPFGKAQASGDLPQEIYLTQAQSRSCTLCSATMMLRSCVYIHGSDLWQQVTEWDVGAYAWTGDGLCWRFGYTLGNNQFVISQNSCSGITVEELKAVLDTHPEGIVLYCGGGAPHGVFLTDYEADTFYCADPAYSYAGDRVPLEQSLLGARHGSQENILSAVCAYWYIESHDLEDRSYFRLCREEEKECRIRVRWDGYARTLPCTEKENGKSEKVFPIRSGEYYTAQTVVYNDAGQIWYRIGEGVYICASDAPSDEGYCVLSDIDEPQNRELNVVPLILYGIIQQKTPQKY